VHFGDSSPSDYFSFPAREGVKEIPLDIFTEIASYCHLGQIINLGNINVGARASFQGYFSHQLLKVIKQFIPFGMAPPFLPLSGRL
jgi:hypothetical protein